MEALCKALHRPAINEMDTLPPALCDESVRLHDSLTHNYTSCKLLTKEMLPPPLVCGSIMRYMY